MLLKAISQQFQPVSWPLQNVVAFTTTISHPHHFTDSSPFGNFNLGLHVGDDRLKVKNNRSILLDYLPEHSAIQWLEQVHGNHVEYIEKVTPLVADAAITQQNKIALAIMTADCLPILIASTDGTEISAIHGGWKPLANNVVRNTVLKMKTKPSNLVAWLGPCIGPHNFEVGENVRAQFLQNNTNFEAAFEQITTDNNTLKYLANLRLIADIQLKELGINAVYSLPHCTYTMQDDYYSFRRNNKTGRMATLICRL